MTCALCEIGAADVDAVLLPSRVDVLLPMMSVHAGDTEAWPSLHVCESCVEYLKPIYDALAEGMSVPAICALTSEDLLLVSRLVYGAAREGVA